MTSSDGHRRPSAAAPASSAAARLVGGGLVRAGLAPGTASGETDISAVPAGAKADYTNYQLYSKLYPNAYQNYKPPAGKIQYCESTFYLGNTYQQGEITAFKQMIAPLAAAGKAEQQLHRPELQQQHRHPGIAAAERDPERL